MVNIKVYTCKCNSAVQNLVQKVRLHATILVQSGKGCRVGGSSRAQEFI